LLFFGFCCFIIQKQIANIQNKRSKTKKGSKRNKRLKSTLNKCYHKKNEQIKQTLHIQSKKLANMNYNTIVIGNLTVKKLMSKEGINKNQKEISCILKGKYKAVRSH